MILDPKQLPIPYGIPLNLSRHGVPVTGKKVRTRACRGSPTQGLPVRDLTILPIQPIDQAVLDRVIEALRARGLGVQLERPILRPRDSYDPQRHQLKAEVLLERVALYEERPVLGVTDADCYAGKLNFVFGIADTGAGVAVVSLARLRRRAPMHIFVSRAMKEIFHELGHAVGLGHCGTRRCVMRFSNSLADTDAKEEQLCAICMRRLSVASRRRQESILI